MLLCNVSQLTQYTVRCSSARAMRVPDAGHALHAAVQAVPRGCGRGAHPGGHAASALLAG